MELETAQNIMRGEWKLTGCETIPELMQLVMGACLTDEGDIICLTCNLPNECCKCEM